MEDLNSLGQKFAHALMQAKTTTRTKRAELEKADKVHVVGAGSMVTAAYEQLRNAAEYSEEHLLLQKAIRRFYRRWFLTRSLDSVAKSGGELITELTFAGYIANDSVAETIANEAGVDEFYADLLPQDKEALASQLRNKYGPSVMVGDGINDAPVLAASNVGIAIGTAGNDIALEAADVALMNANLRTIPYLIRHGRKSVRKLHVNLGLALGIKAFMIIGGVLGIVPLWMAVLGDDGATILVIANALPLLGHRLKS